MSSLITGYEYDIFISYRQNDNKSGWVTEFVKELRQELSTIIKDPVSVYFDSNLYDGLTETDDVTKSLEGKLKCVIFIPVISQTYCDTKSFAWNNEFLVFKKRAESDQIGPFIKLLNGNVTSRILPVKIHEIDQKDKSLLEDQLNGPLRSIDFILRSVGVNRPLKPSDNQEQAINKIFYRDQINKTANAVKAIVDSLAESNGGSAKSADVEKSPVRARMRNVGIAIGVLLLTSLAAYFFLTKSTPLKDPSESGVAVLPFINNTGAPDLNYYGIGMASEIRTKLSMSKQFNFISSLQATLPYLNTQKTTRQIGEELGVDYILSGLYQKAGDKIKIETELISARSGQVLWTLKIERALEDLFQVQSDIAGDVLKRFSKTAHPTNATTTANLEAYAYYVRGKQMLENVYGDSLTISDSYLPVINQFEKAINLDSGFIDAWAELIPVECFVLEGERKNPARRTRIEKYNRYISEHFGDSWQRKLIQGQYALRVTREYPAAFSLMLQVVDENPDNVHATYALSSLYKRSMNFEKAVEFAVKQINLSPGHGGHWMNLGNILMLIGDSTNSLKAYLRGWNLSHSKNFGRTVLQQALSTNLPLSELPEGLKTQLGYEFVFWKLSMERDWQEAIKISRRMNDNLFMSYAYAEAGKKDSARYFAAKAVSMGEVDSMYYFSISGDLTKALALNGKSAGSIDRSEFSKMDQVGKLMMDIEIFISGGDYKQATETLQKINQEFPEFADYGAYYFLPWYDRIKADYRPFRKALNELKIRNHVDINNYIKLN